MITLRNKEGSAYRLAATDAKARYWESLGYVRVEPQKVEKPKAEKTKAGKAEKSE